MICSAPDDFAVRRVAGITVNQETTFDIIAPADQAAVLWGALDFCVIPTEHRAHVRFGRIPAALAMINVRFRYGHTNAPILGPLITNYAMFVRSLLVLKIARNDCDESAALGAFAALATHLQELTFSNCGLTSVQGLDGLHCEYLRKVNFFSCNHLGSLRGLENRPNLQEVNASCTAITSIDPLRTCAALTNVLLENCRHLSSIEALVGHHWLQEVNVSATPISSIESLRTCPALTTVVLHSCKKLSSIGALADHLYLAEFDASYTGITSVEALRSCPSLREVALWGCKQLPADIGLPASVVVIRDILC